MATLISAGLVTFGEEPLIRTCDCISNKISVKLARTYSFSELMEAKRDKTKQLILFEKILSNKTIQEQAINCIEATKKHYEEFRNKFDKE